MLVKTAEVDQGEDAAAGEGGMREQPKRDEGSTTGSGRPAFPPGECAAIDFAGSSGAAMLALGVIPFSVAVLLSSTALLSRTR